MKSLVIGCNGMVGQALMRNLDGVLGSVHNEIPERNQVHIDLTNFETIYKVFNDYRPDVVYLPAAITNVDACEDTKTDAVNIRGAAQVLRLCEQFEAKLVYFSSSYVFDGRSNWPYTPEQETNPINHYGVQKQTVEELIQSSGIDFLIVRTVGVFGPEYLPKNFVSKVIAGVASGQTVYTPDNQYMNPVYSDDLAKVTVSLVRDGFDGIWHVAGDTCMTKYEFAKTVASLLGQNMMVRPTSESVGAERPKNGCLDCYSLEEVGISVPRFDRLEEFVSQEVGG